MTGAAPMPMLAAVALLVADALIKPAPPAADDPRTIAKSLTAHAGAVLDNSIIVAGGVYGDAHKALLTPLRLRLPDEWTVGPAMPGPRDFPGAAVVGGRFYVVGGTSRAEASIGTVLSWDGASTEWKTHRPMPTPRSRLACVAYRDKIYAIGGMDSRGNSSACEVYDPATDTWKTLAAMPTARHGHAALSWNKWIFVMGGEAGAAFEHTGVMEVYDTETDSWRAWAAMLGARLFFGAAVVNSEIVVFGGRDKEASPSWSFHLKIQDWKESPWPPALDRARFVSAILTNEQRTRELVILGGERSDGGPTREGILRIKCPDP